jgi:uncharacterized protein
MHEKTTKVQHDTAVHVAQFLQEGVGATRQARIALDGLPLDGDLVARQVAAEAKLTRIPTGILAEGEVRATVTMQCIRCLEDFAQSAAAAFADEYRPTVDVLTGVAVRPDPEAEDEDDIFGISDLHLLDLRESLRQSLVLGLPMAPLCRDDCPGLPEATELLSEGDARLAVLGRLLTGEADGAAGEGAERAGRGARRRAGR